MPAKKKCVVLKSKQVIVNLALTGEDRLALSEIEGYLAKRYNRSRVDISNAECLRYAINRAVETIAIKAV